MKINELRQEKAGKVDEARALIDGAEKENRDLNEEEKAQYDGLMTEISSLSVRIQRQEDTEKEELDNAQVADQEDRETKYGEFRSLGEMIATVCHNPYDPRLSKRFIYEDGIPVANMTTDEQGGFRVPDRFLDEVLKIDLPDAIVRPRARVLEAGFPPDAQIDIPRLDQVGHGLYAGVEVEWIEEGEEKPASKPKWTLKSLKPHEVAGRVVVTDKLLRNVQAFDSFIKQQLRDAVIGAEDAAFLTGNGINQPTGLIGHASNVLVNRAGAGAVAYQDIVNMYAARLRQATGYAWIASSTILPQLMTMEDTGGHLIWQPNAREGAPGTLIGLPCIESDLTPTLGVRGDLILAALKYYIIKDGSGIFVDALSSGEYFDHNKTVIKITWNVDGNPWPNGPFTMRNGETHSPFVVLDVPAGA